jgi:Ca2+-binding EF-hand superfamily protein
MKAAFQKLGFNVSLAEIRKAISAHDMGKDGTIDYEEFKVIFGFKSQPEETQPVVPKPISKSK